MATITDVTSGKNPNEGRQIINDNFEAINDELITTIHADGSVPMQSNLNMNNNRVIALSDGIDGTDGATVRQVTSAMNRLIVKRSAYVVPGFIGAERLYPDGTGSEYALKVGSPQRAFEEITDATIGNEWTVFVPHNGSYYASQDFSNLKDYINIFGEGNPVIEITDGTVPSYSTINKNGKFKGFTIKYNQGKNLLINVGTWNDCWIFLSNITGITPRNLTFGQASMMDCMFVADNILLDGTTNNFIHKCTMNVDLGGAGTNDVYTTNFVIPLLENYYDIPL